VRALGEVRFAAGFAPTWTLTTPTVERAASFVLTARAARVCAYLSILVFSRHHAVSGGTTVGHHNETALGCASQVDGVLGARKKRRDLQVKTAAFCFDWQERLEKAGG
jgi:hypothetical protein